MCFIHKGYRDYHVQQENVHLNLFCSGVEQIKKVETKQLTVVFQQLTVFLLLHIQTHLATNTFTAVSR